MKKIDSILAVTLRNGRLPLISDPRFLQSHLMVNALALGRWLGATVHALVPHGEPEELDLSVAGQGLTVHSGGGDFLSAIRNSVEKYHCDLVVIDDGREKEVVLENIGGPVMYIPPHLRLSEMPIRSLMVPLSGEQRRSEASRFALTLAEQTKTPVDFLHVSPVCHLCPSARSMETLPDQQQHELPEMIDKVISEASPYSSAPQKAWVREFHHCVGLTKAEIERVILNFPGAALVVEWKGSLTTGRAEVVKCLLLEAHHAIVFIKVKPEKSAELRIGRWSRDLSAGGLKWDDKESNHKSNNHKSSNGSGNHKSGSEFGY